MKKYGSFHLTLGMALEESDNGNRSAIHWDIVKIEDLYQCMKKMSHYQKYNMML